MAVVELIGEADAPLLLRGLYSEGDPGPIVAALAHVPELCETTVPFVGRALGPSSVSLRLKEIAILRTSVLMKCRYCTDAHTVVALDAGLSRDEVCMLRQEEEHELGSPLERALLAWIDEVAAGQGAVPSVLADDLREHLPDHAIVELTATIGATLFLNRFCSALHLPTSDETMSRLAELGLASRTDWAEPSPGTNVSIGG